MGCEIRKENTTICWKELKKLTDNFKENGIDIKSYLFEFGENFIFEDSIKIDMKLDFYERSKKINVVINHEVNNDCDFISIMDSDTFFSPNQYEKLMKDILELETKNQRIFYTYNLLDINEHSRNFIIDFDAVELKYEELEQHKDSFSWRHSWGAGTLGGFFIVPTKELKMIGGFNENFLTWGGEDDEAHQRMKNLCSWVPKLFEGPHHLFHPKNENDTKYYVRVYSDEYFEINKVEKPR